MYKQRKVGDDDGVSWYVEGLVTGLSWLSSLGYFMSYSSIYLYKQMVEFTRKEVYVKKCTMRDMLET